MLKGFVRKILSLDSDARTTATFDRFTCLKDSEGDEDSVSGILTVVADRRCNLA